MVEKPFLVEKLFVLGGSGSGKSTISRCIEMLARDRGWSAHFINDYGILYQMFRDDTDCKQFRPTDYNGFDVLEMSVYDTALDELNRQTQTLADNLRENKLIIIEFARCDYRGALKYFDDHLLHTAHFLFLDADIETCKQRIHERIKCPQSLDDHFVPDHVIECFGQESCRQYIESGLERDYGIAADRVRILDTSGSIEEVTDDVKQLVEMLLSDLIVADI